MSKNRLTAIEPGHLISITSQESGLTCHCLRTDSGMLVLSPDRPDQWEHIPLIGMPDPNDLPFGQFDIKDLGPVVQVDSVEKVPDVINDPDSRFNDPDIGVTADLCPVCGMPPGTCQLVPATDFGEEMDQWMVQEGRAFYGGTDADDDENWLDELIADVSAAQAETEGRDRQPRLRIIEFL